MSARRMTVILASLALATAACDDEGVFEPSVQNLAGVYTFVGHTTQLLGTSNVVDVLATAPTCWRDNSLQINANGTFAFIDGGTKCSPALDGTGTWALPSSTTLLVDGVPYEIRFDGTTLIERAYETAGGTTTVRTITMRKQ